MNLKDCEMAEITLSGDQIIKIVSNLASLTTAVNTLSEKVAEQEKKIEELKLLAERGKGSIWVLMALGTGFGALASNFKSILTFILR